MTTLKKANKALIINSEHNTAFSHEGDDKSGYLWDDAATAVVVTPAKISENALKVVDLKTRLT